MTTTIRKFSPVGPCINQGELVRETAQFYVVKDRFDRDGGLVRYKKERPGHYSNYHKTACPSCRDHAQTQYPNGYED